MNVLHIGTSDYSGGAARAAYRLKQGLSRHGVESRFLVRWKVTDDPDVRTIAGNRLLTFADKIAGKITDWAGVPYVYYPSTAALVRHPWVREADVLQLHNLHGNYFAFPFLPALSRLRPVVWYLHDMWSFTGHCAYAYECEEWKTGCRRCTCGLESYPPLRWDTSALLWKLKNRVYSRSRMVIVTPSRWLSAQAKASPLLSRFPIRTIPYGLDTDIFVNTPKSEARRRLGIPSGKKVLLFGSHAVSDPRKGADYVKEVLRRLQKSGRHDLFVLAMGAGDPAPLVPPGMPFFQTAREPAHTLSDDRQLALTYAAADLFLLPTLADNLPLTLQESMSCGTPVVAFDVGGVSDAVRSGRTGYLARYKDVDDFARGVETLLSDDDLRRTLSEGAREVAVTEYSIGTVGKSFLDLYSGLLTQP